MGNVSQPESIALSESNRNPAEVHGFQYIPGPSVHEQQPVKSESGVDSTTAAPISASTVGDADFEMPLSDAFDSAKTFDEKVSMSLKVIEWAIENFKGGLVMSTSFGIQSAVLLHLISRVPGGEFVPVIWIDTGYLPPETYQYAAALQEMMKVNVKIYQSNLSTAHMEAVHGKLWESDEPADHRLYGLIRKVMPMRQAQQELGATCMLAGLRRNQTNHRQNLKVFEKPAGFDLQRIRSHSTASNSNGSNDSAGTSSSSAPEVGSTDNESTGTISSGHEAQEKEDKKEDPLTRSKTNLQQQQAPAGVSKRADETCCKMYPILNWSQEDVDEYFRLHELPAHPLVAQGYTTVGDAHSSRPRALTDQSDRDSRFGASKQQECGLHTETGPLEEAQSFILQARGRAVSSSSQSLLYLEQQRARQGSNATVSTTPGVSPAPSSHSLSSLAVPSTPPSTTATPALHAAAAAGAGSSGGVTTSRVAPTPAAAAVFATMKKIVDAKNGTRKQQQRGQPAIDSLIPDSRYIPRGGSSHNAPSIPLSAGVAASDAEGEGDAEVDGVENDFSAMSSDDTGSIDSFEEPRVPLALPSPSSSYLPTQATQELLTAGGELRVPDFYIPSDLPAYGGFEKSEEEEERGKTGLDLGGDEAEEEEEDLPTFLYEVYGRTACKFCKAAKLLLSRRNLPFISYTVRKPGDPPAVGQASKKASSIGRSKKDAYPKQDIPSFSPNQEPDVVELAELIMRVREVRQDAQATISTVPQIFLSRSNGECTYIGGFTDLCETLSVEQEESSPILASVSSAMASLNNSNNSNSNSSNSTEDGTPSAAAAVSNGE